MKRSPGLKYAVQGIAHAFRSQLNLRLHLSIGFLVVLTGYFLQISLVEWCIILICIGSVLAAELFNTALENHIDLTHPEWNEIAGRSKDIAAGAVLMVSVISAIIGLIIFLPRFFEIIN